MNKILQSASTGEINVTNDGATILKQCEGPRQHFKGSGRRGWGWNYDCHCSGCGVAREAEKLIAKKVRRQTIVEGYRIASLAALKALDKATCEWLSKCWHLCSKNLSSKPHKLREDLFNIGRPTLSSKDLSQDKDYFANLVVDAVLRLRYVPVQPPLEQRQTEVLAQGSTDLDAKWFLYRRGLHPEQTIEVNSPKRMENVKILIASTCTFIDGDLILANLDSSNGHRQNQYLWLLREGPRWTARGSWRSWNGLRECVHI